MKKTLLALCVILGLAACSDKAQEQKANEKPVIKIGAVLPLSGSQANMGEAAKAGMLKAIAEKSKDDLHYNYELVFEDNQGKLPMVSTATNKIIMQDKVDVISTITSPFARIMAPVTDQHDIMQFAFSFEDKNYKPFAKYGFIQGMPTQEVAEFMYNEFKKNNGDNIAVFAENLGLIALITNALEAKFKQDNVKYVINTFNPGERDFRLTIAKTKESGFTEFAVISMPPERDIVLKQLTEAGVAKSAMQALCLDMNTPTNLYEGIKTVTYNPGAEDLIETIEKEYNVSSTFGSAVFYDYVNMIIDAYENLYKDGYKPSAEELTTYIHNRKSYKCANGECVVQDNGFILNHPKVRIYKDGKWLNLEE